MEFLRALPVAWGLLRRERPALVIGFGNYLSVAVLLLAKLRGIPTIVQEQNAWPGAANKFLARFANLISRARLFAGLLPASRTQFLGNPVRDELLAMFPLDELTEARRTFSIPDGARVLALLWRFARGGGG